jgi:hypothetical protein
MQIVLDPADESKPVLDELTLVRRVVQAKVEDIRTTPAPDRASIERERAARTAAIDAEAHGVLLRATDLDASASSSEVMSIVASAATPRPTAARPDPWSSSDRSIGPSAARVAARSIRRACV